MTQHERLETALQNASAAGDTEAATTLATELRSRRASEGQQVTTIDEVDGTDPLATIPTNLMGVDLPPDIRNALLKGRGMEEGREKRLLAARIGGRIAAMSGEGNTADEIARSDVGKALRSMTTGLFGLGDPLAAGATVIGSGFKLSFGEALEAQRAFRQEQERQSPILTAAGEITGAIGATFLGGKGILRSTKGTRFEDVARRTLRFKKGETLKNIGKASLAGGTFGAITEQITEGEGVRGAAFGALGGPLGLAMAKTLGVTLSVFKNNLIKAANVSEREVASFMSGDGAQSLKLLASKIGISAAEIGRRFLNFKNVTGKTPAMADIINDKAAAELSEVIAGSSAATQVAREGAETLLSKKAGDIAGRISRKTTSSRVKQEAARRSIAEKQFDLAEGDTIKFSASEVDNILNDKTFLSGIGVQGRKQLDDAFVNWKPGQGIKLSGQLVNDIRKSLGERGAGATGFDLVFRELKGEIEDIARVSSPRFGAAIDEFAGRSQKIRGFQEGRKVLTAKTSEFEAKAAQQAANLERKALGGSRVGARTELADVAKEGLGRSMRLVNELAEDGGLVQRLRAVVPESEVDALVAMAKAQSQSIRNIGRLAPRAKGDGGENLLRTGVDAAIAAAPVAGTTSRISAFGRLLKAINPKLSDRVVSNLARDAFDPKKTQQIINVLRRAELDETDILNLFVASATGGTQINLIGDK